MSMQCRVCGEPVQVMGEPFTGQAVHAGTGSEAGPDGHLAAPIDLSPEPADWAVL
jgi:hypothetical protein